MELTKRYESYIMEETPAPPRSSHSKPFIIRDTIFHHHTNATMTITTNCPSHGESRFQFGISFLEQRAEEFRSTEVDWLFIKDSGLIDQVEYDFITKFDKQCWLEKAEYLDSRRKDCGDIFIQLISKINKENILSYLLVLIDEILERDPKMSELFANNFSDEDNKETSEGAEAKTSNYLFFLLNRDNEFQANLGSIILARIMSNVKRTIAQSDLQLYFVWLFDKLRVQNNAYIHSVARSLQMMVKKETFRETFLKLGGVDVLITSACKARDYQTQYQLIFCIWCLSFNSNFNEDPNLFFVISNLVQILGVSVKEKVSRIILATLKNLLEKPKSEEVIKNNAIVMIKNNACKFIELLQTKKYDDTDIEEDLDFVAKKLVYYTEGFSTLDEYVAEVRTGQLEWGVIHKSASFWHENASKLNANNHELLKILVALLDSDDPNVVSIAAHDIGQYAKYYQLGKKNLEDLGAKIKITTLLLKKDQHPEIRSQTLICLQKIMVNNLQTFDNFIARSSKSKTETAIHH